MILEWNVEGRRRKEIHREQLSKDLTEADKEGRASGRSKISLR
jgi:hypothetical protein